MATEVRRGLSTVTGVLLLGAERFGVLALTRLFPVLAGWAAFTHGLVVFALSFVAVAAMPVRPWHRWALLAGVSAGTFVELLVFHVDARPWRLSIALSLISVAIAAFMAIDSWRAERSIAIAGEEWR